MENHRQYVKKIVVLTTDKWLTQIQYMSTSFKN